MAPTANLLPFIALSCPVAMHVSYDQRQSARPVSLLQCRKRQGLGCQIVH